MEHGTITQADKIISLHYSIIQKKINELVSNIYTIGETGAQ